MARSTADKAKSAVKRAGVKGVNKPKRTPGHPTKSHIVVAKEGDKVKTIRFGQQGVSGSPPKKGESEAAKKRRASFKARHAKNIAKGKMSAAFWSSREKW
jgi:phage gp16-like protein